MAPGSEQVLRKWWLLWTELSYLAALPTCALRRLPLPLWGDRWTGSGAHAFLAGVFTWDLRRYTLYLLIPYTGKPALASRFIDMTTLLPLFIEEKWKF